MNRRDFLKKAALATASLSLTGCGGTYESQNLLKKHGRPNILFAIADDASFPHTSAYGCSWIKTPGFDRVAGEGILFMNAYTPNAKCAPSRSCILTGRNSWQLEEAANHVPYFPEKFKTYPEAFEQNGYFSGKTGKGWAPGDPGKINGKRRQLAGMPFDARKTKPPARYISNNDYAANFEDFLNAKPADQPFCFWYGSTEPHRAYEYQAGITKGGKRTSDITRVPDFWPDNDIIRTDMLDYAFEIEYFDSHLLMMLNILEQRDMLDNTIVVVTSDNGMPFPRCKGMEFEYSNHMPLAIMWKNGIKSPGRISTDYVSFIDFAPTYAEVAGLDWKKIGMAETPGRPLTDIFYSKNSNPKRDHVLIGKERHDLGRPNDWGYPIRGIVKDQWLYLNNFETSRWPSGNPETGYLNCDGSPTKTWILDNRTDPVNGKYWQMAFAKRTAEELYNLKVDPECVNNLCGKPEFKSLRDELKNQLFRELKEQKDPRMFGNGKIFDEYQYSDPRQRNLYNRYMGGEKELKNKTGWVNPTDYEDGPLD